MSALLALPRSLLPIAARVAAVAVPPDVRTATGLAADDWDALSRRLPDLGRHSGARAARCRKIVGILAAAAIRSPRHRPDWTGPPAGEAPTLWATAHLGDLRSLRYLLRIRGIAAAQIVDLSHVRRETAAIDDQDFDRRFPIDFPHVVFSPGVHRVRALLSRGSLIAAADRPAELSVTTTVLGGPLPVDPRPFRLAKIVGVPCRPIFLTLRRGRLVLVSGPPIACQDPAQAARAFGDHLAAAASGCPAAFDGFTHRGLAQPLRKR